MKDPAFNGQAKKSTHSVAVGDKVMFTQGILEGLTGVVAASNSRAQLLVRANDFPTGVRVVVAPDALRPLRPIVEPPRRKFF